MNKKITLWISLIILLFSIPLAACSQVSLPEPTPVATAQVEKQEPVAERPTSTPQPIQSLQQYTNQDFGISLTYPDGYEAHDNFYHSVIFLAPQGTEGHRERAILSIELALDIPAEWYASRLKEENDFLGTGITSTVMDIDGQQAYILGRLPGQDLNRQVFIVHNGILYHLTFFPDEPNTGEEYQQMEALYESIINSLRFMPGPLEVPPVTSMSNMIYQLDRALEARSEDDIVRPLGDAFFMGYWEPNTPEGVTYERLSRSEIPSLVLDNYLSQAPELIFQYPVDWTRVIGSPDPFSAYFPDEFITPLWVQGWGPQGSDEAVIIIARRGDGSLYWRGMFVTQGSFAQ